MRNKYFLIWCIAVLIFSTLGNYLDFISGYIVWEHSFYDKDVLGMSALAQIIITLIIGYILYEPKDNK